MKLFLVVVIILACPQSHQGTQGYEQPITDQASIGITPAVVYRSLDGGRSWIPFANGLPSESTVSAFLAEPYAIWATTPGVGLRNQP